MDIERLPIIRSMSPLVLGLVVVVVAVLAIAYYKKMGPFSSKTSSEKGSFRAHADNGAPNSTGVSDHVTHTGHDQGSLARGVQGMRSDTIEGQIFHDDGLAAHARNLDIPSAQVLACVGN